MSVVVGLFIVFFLVALWGTIDRLACSVIERNAIMADAARRSMERYQREHPVPSKARVTALGTKVGPDGRWRP